MKNIHSEKYHSNSFDPTILYRQEMSTKFQAFEVLYLCSIGCSCGIPINIVVLLLRKVRCVCECSPFKTPRRHGLELTF